MNSAFQQDQGVRILGAAIRLLDCLLRVFEALLPSSPDLGLLQSSSRFNDSVRCFTGWPHIHF